jgi:DNA-directed RNA polymerase subunit RPC12/RpoP
MQTILYECSQCHQQFWRMTPYANPEEASCPHCGKMLDFNTPHTKFDDSCRACKLRVGSPCLTTLVAQSFQPDEVSYAK